MRNVIAYFETNDKVAAQAARQMIAEGHNFEIDKRYSARLDRAHQPGMQDHVHVQFKGNDLSIINRDGTQSHNTTRDDVPKYVLDYLRNKELIAEAKIRKDFGVPQAVINAAVGRYRSWSLWARLRRLLKRIAFRQS